GLVIWDLTAIAMDESNAKRRELYRRVVLASGSIPIMVQPVKIDGNLYADGGTRAQLFFEKGFFPALRQIKKYHEEHKSPLPNLTLHIIVNGKLGLEAMCASDCLKGIASRALETLLDANEIGDLYHLKYVLGLFGFLRSNIRSYNLTIIFLSSQLHERNFLLVLPCAAGANGSFQNPCNFPVCLR